MRTNFTMHLEKASAIRELYISTLIQDGFSESEATASLNWNGYKNAIDYLKTFGYKVDISMLVGDGRHIATNITLIDLRTGPLGSNQEKEGTK